jgi:hypothetical protein
MHSYVRGQCSLDVSLDMFIRDLVQWTQWQWNCTFRVQHYEPNIFFCRKKLHFVRNWRSKVTSGDTETKTTLSKCELYVSEKSISLVFKQALYELCSLYGTKVMIIFSGGGMTKTAIFYDFCTPALQKLQDIRCWNFARILISMESTSLPTFIKNQRRLGWKFQFSVVICYGMTHFLCFDPTDMTYQLQIQPLKFVHACTCKNRHSSWVELHVTHITQHRRLVFMNR